MEEFRHIRINKVLRELNISLERAVEFLKRNGILINPSPNSKINEDELLILFKQFNNRKIPDLIKDIEGYYNILLFEKINVKDENYLKNFYVLDEIEEIIELNINSVIIYDITYLEQFKNLKILSLINCNIRNIESLKKLKKLKSLNLQTNIISDYSILESLKELKELYISDNTIQEDKFPTLFDLEILSLRDCYLCNLGLIKNYKSLKKLDLSLNIIEDLSFLKSFKNLTVLNLSYNNISDLYFLKGMNHLEELNLRNNQIKDITALKDFKELINLNLRSNQISDIRVLKDIKKLAILDLNKNEINDIYVLNNLKELVSLNLGSNQIYDISVLKGLKKLHSLFLSFNKISDSIQLFHYYESGYEFNVIDANKRIYIDGNPLDESFLNILSIKEKKDRNIKLKNYFNRLLQGDSISVKRMKLILLGNTRSGKTTLADILSKETKANGDSTHGVNFFQFEIGDVEVKGYDFGGQDYYHNTHYSFFDEKSLYLLVWGNGQKDELCINSKSEMLFPLNYWLGSLNKYAYKNSFRKLLNPFLQINNLNNIGEIENVKLKEILDLKHFEINEDEIPDDMSFVHFIKNMYGKLNNDNEVDFILSNSNVNFKTVKERLKVLDISQIPNFIKPETGFYENKELFENYKRDFGSLIDFAKSDDYSFQTFVLQNIEETKQKKWLNEFQLKENYTFIKDFKSFCFKNEKLEINDFVNKVSKDFVIETKVLNIDNNVAKAFEEKRNHVILKIPEVKQLEFQIKEYDDEKMDSLLNSLHSILACFYFKIKDEIKDKLYNNLEDVVIVDLEKFTEWIYQILNQEELLEQQEGYFSREDAKTWLKEDFSKSKIDYILAFMLEYKLIFKMKNQDVFFAPNYLKKNQSPTEKLFLNSFEKPSVEYLFKEYFHTSILSELINKYFDQLVIENENNKWKYALWKNKLILYEDDNTSKLVYISFEINSSESVIKVSRYNNLVSDDFLLEICNFIETQIKSYDYEKFVLSKKGNYVPYEVLNTNNQTEELKKTNFIFYENTIYRKSDFKMFLTNKDDYPMKKIFISYSKFDEDYKEELVDHLITLRDEGAIDDFNCDQIDLGENSHEVIQKNLEECDYMIALVSRKFLNTNYIREFEVKKAKELGKKIIPIIIKPCDWETSIVSEFHASLRGRIISIDNDLYINKKVKEVTEIERQGNWKFVINEFRSKILIQP
jgi:Leucine-rich repeat (LRR) protein